MSQFPNGLRRRRWRRERGAAGTRRPGRGGAGGTRRGGDTVPLPPHLRAAPRQGPAHGGRSEWGCTPLPSPAPLAPLSPRRGEAAAPGGHPFPRHGRLYRGGSERACARGDARPPPRFAFCLAFPGGWGSPSPGKKSPSVKRPEAAGSGSPSWDSSRGALRRAGRRDGSSLTPGNGEDPEERPDLHRVPHPALLNKTRCSKTHK